MYGMTPGFMGKVQAAVSMWLVCVEKRFDLDYRDGVFGLKLGDLVDEVCDH